MLIRGGKLGTPSRRTHEILSTAVTRAQKQVQQQICAYLYRFLLPFRSTETRIYTSDNNQLQTEAALSVQRRDRERETHTGVVRGDGLGMEWRVAVQEHDNHHVVADVPLPLQLRLRQCDQLVITGQRSVAADRWGGGIP